MVRDRRAKVADVHEVAGGMPYVKVVSGGSENPVYQVGGKSFVFFRTPRPDAVDPLAQASRRRAERWLAEHSLS